MARLVIDEKLTFDCTSNFYLTATWDRICKLKEKYVKILINTNILLDYIL